MRFLLKVRFKGADTVIAELPAAEQQTVTAEFEAIRRSAGVIDGNQLQAAGTAATVRVEARRRRLPPAPPSRREASLTATTSTTRQDSTR
jgi:hypothetical protein